MLCLQDEGGKQLEAMHGELVLDVEQGTIFSVSQYRGQPGLGYFCLEAEKATLYHRGVRAGGQSLRGLQGPWTGAGAFWRDTGLAGVGGQLAWQGAHQMPPQRPWMTTCCPVTWSCPALRLQPSWSQPSTHQRKE